MKTATLTEKVNRWLHEHLAMKTTAKLLGGLALGALVMATTALPLGTTYADEPARPLSSEQIQCYPEDVVLGWCYGFAATPGPSLISDATIEILADLARMYAGLDEMVPSDPAFTTDTHVSGVQFEEWAEAGLDSYTYYRFMSEQGRAASRLAREQLQAIDDLEIMGILWRIDDQGRVVVVGEPGESVAATVIHGYDRSLDDEFMSDAPFFHTLNQGKLTRLPSINGITCYPEDDC